MALKAECKGLAQTLHAVTSLPPGSLGIGHTLIQWQLCLQVQGWSWNRVNLMVFRETEVGPGYIAKVAGSVPPRKNTNDNLRSSWFTGGTRSSVARILATKMSTGSSERNAGRSAQCSTVGQPIPFNEKYLLSCLLACGYNTGSELSSCCGYSVARASPLWSIVLAVHDYWYLPRHSCPWGGGLGCVTCFGRWDVGEVAVC